MTTAAAIDRLVHHSVILELDGIDSYRIAQAKKRRKETELNETRKTIPLKGRVRKEDTKQTK